jgi:hypothetical protein
MLPLLLLQLLYKLIWLMAVAFPMWSAVRATDLTKAMVIGAVFDLIAIPWAYVWANYLKQPGDRWRSMSIHRGRDALTPGGGMADDLSEAARAASREGNHALAERLFHQSWVEHGNVHSAANEVYERYRQSKATAEEVRAAVHKNGIAGGGHGQWLLRQVEGSE